MFKRLFAIAAVFGAAALAPPQAEAQSPSQVRKVCAPRALLTANLAEKYGETKQGVGLANGAAAFEVWRSDKSGSWTMLMTRPNGVSCVIASGNSWHEPHIVPVGDPA